MGDQSEFLQPLLREVHSYQFEEEPSYDSIINQIQNMLDADLVSYDDDDICEKGDEFFNE